ncbi:hypothetical protein [Pseudorhodoplanes sp.]|uniref:hypothetical protein n=1 Tax=Pseudorhodoplanes sp. TaxID=1934341 RepID=UPI003D0D672C
MTNPYRLQDGGVLVLDEHGNIIKTAPNDASCIVPDGGKVSVPLTLMDGKSKDDNKPTFDAAHQRPRHGVIPMNDRVRLDASHAMMVKRTQDAWKKPAPPPAPAASPAAAPQAPIVSADAKAAYERRSKRLEDAWKNVK